jgi:hypothetical protein
MDEILVAIVCILAGFLAGNAAAMFFAHWLHAVMAAFGKGPVSAPHRIDVLAALMLTLLHPLPWVVLIGGWFGIRRVIFGSIIPEGWRWFWMGAGCWVIYVAALLASMMLRTRKAKAKAARGDP